MVFRYLTLLAALLTFIFPPQTLHAQGKPDFSNYEYSVTEEGTFGLYKPKGWKVATQTYPNGRLVFVTDPQDLCFASGLFLENINPKDDSVAFAGSTLEKRQQADAESETPRVKKHSRPDANGCEI